MHIEPERITGLVLAGGRGSRMGHVDKGLQTFRGMPMVQHALTRLKPQVGAIIVNANQNLADYEAFGWPVKSDQLIGYAGPLAGLQAGLAHCETEYLVTVPCDSPFFPHDLVARLADALLTRRADVAVATTEEEGGYQPHPVFALMRASLLPDLTHYLESGGRKIDTWYRSLAYVEVVFPDASAFRNINTREELQRYEPS